jgi:hypothetical protein
MPISAYKQGHTRWFSHSSAKERTETSGTHFRVKLRIPRSLCCKKVIL